MRARGAPTILIVDDEAQNRRLLAVLLRPEGYLTESVASGEEALATIARHAPDLVLLDIMMPGIDGYQVATTLKANHATANIPIIMVTAHSERSARLAGLDAGAEEFLTKPVDRTELWLRVRNLLRLKAFGDLQQHSFLLEELVKARTAELQHQAHHDALTGLPNRTLFYETLEKTLVLATGQEWKVAVMFIDLDHFKNINDTMGHAVGDALLVQFSNRLLRCVRLRDTVGRLGGDEFALILLMQNGLHGAAQVAAKIREALRPPFNLFGHEVVITASIGITIHPDDASTPDVLIKYADTAMYQAKHAGRDTCRFFTAQMNTNVLLRQEMECALRKAVENGEFVLLYQPKVDLLSGNVVGMEALLRWERPGHGLLTPDGFIATLEETGLIVRVGNWVIASACAQIKAWLDAGIGAVRVSVNVAGRQFLECNLEAEVFQALHNSGVPPELLELELTETSLMLNTERTITCLRHLREKGVHISIDDFGTGYSSLAYLRRFPIDKLKIDIAFIRDVITNPDDAAIVRAIISMAHSLNLIVIAEGVETEAQLNYLRRLLCDQIQGYLFSRPLSAVQMTQLLVQRRRLLLPVCPGLPAQAVLVVEDAPTRVN